MGRVLAAQFANLSEADDLCDALRNPAPAPELAELLGLDISTQARALMWRGTPFHSGDMLLIDGEYQLAQAFALVRDGSFLLIAQAHRRECEVTKGAWRVRRANLKVTSLGPSVRVEFAPAWHFDTSDTAIVLE